MRTYSRKKQNHQLIEDVKQLCRLCLEKCEGETVAIFKDDQAAIAALALRIMVCVGIEIHKEDDLPNNICENCHKELERCYMFRKKCEMSYQKLKSHLHALKFKDKNPPNDSVVKLRDEVEEPEIIEPNKKEWQDENLKETEKIEIELIEQENVESPDLKTFLASILMELGVMRTENGVLVRDEGVQHFEVVTGDDDLINIELVEESDDETNDADVQMKSAETLNSETLDETQLVLDVPSNQQTKTVKKKSGAWCRECGLVLSCRSACVRHAAVHSRRKPHQCALCPRAFKQKSVLERHKLVHQARRPFPCSVCDKSFTQRGALAAHAQTHAAPPARPLALHPCHHCDKVFLYASGLTRHMSSHAGVTHRCDNCARHFADASSLARHRHNAHNDLNITYYNNTLHIK